MDDKQLIALAQAGDQQAATTLILRYKRWATWIADKIARQHDRSRKQEMHAAAVAGLWEAILRFDCTRDTSFMSYAVWWVRKYVHEQINEYMQSHGMSDIDLYAEDLGDQQETDLQALQQDQEHIRYLVSTCKELTACEAAYASMRWVEGLRAVDVVARMGYSKQRASQLEQQVLAKLRRVIRFGA